MMRRSWCRYTNFVLFWVHHALAQASVNPALAVDCNALATCAAFSAASVWYLTQNKNITDAVTLNCVFVLLVAITPLHDVNSTSCVLINGFMHTSYWLKIVRPGCYECTGCCDRSASSIAASWDWCCYSTFQSTVRSLLFCLEPSSCSRFSFLWCALHS